MGVGIGVSNWLCLWTLLVINKILLNRILKGLDMYLVDFLPWPTCLKLTMSLVNASVKLWSLNMAYMLIFLLKKCE